MAIFAKNSMLNSDGFSPYHIIYGENPRIPSVTESAPPALECVSSKFVADHILALNTARKSFLEADCSSRIKKALVANLRHDDGPFLRNDKVYFKRNGNWHGPGTVMGQDGTVVFVRNGTNIIRVHKNDLRRVENRDIHQEQSKPTEDSDSVSSMHPKQATEHENTTRVLCEESSDNEDEIHVSDSREQQEIMPTEPSEKSSSVIPEAIGSSAHEIGPGKGKILRFVSEVPGFEGKPIEATITSRGGKAGGKHRNWWNVEYKAPDEISGRVDCLNLDELKDLTIANTALIVTSDTFKEAKYAELQSWQQNLVYTEVPDEGQGYLTCRWVLTEKSDRKKARLVVRGFEDPDYDFLVKDSPTCSKDAIRILLNMCSVNQWTCRSIDIRTAFLQGEPLKRMVFVKPPKDVEQRPPTLWKLNRCIYGLVDAARHWYERVKRELTSSGCTISTYDPCLFYRRNQKSELIGVIATHVDDFWWSGTSEFENSTIKHILEVFDVRSNEKAPFEYLGFSISQSENCVEMSLEKYVIQLEELVVPESESTDVHSSSMRGVLGKLQWIATQVRPDIAFEVNNCLTRVKFWTREDFIAINKLIRKLKYSASTCKLKFQDIGDSETWTIWVYSDASLGNLDCGGTQAGYVIFLAGTKGKNLISWRSQKLRRVVKSTLSAEAMACGNGLDAAVLCQKIIEEFVGRSIPIVAFTDSKSLFDNIYSTKIPQDKRLRVEIADLRSILTSKNNSKIHWVNGSNQ